MTKASKLMRDLEGATHPDLPDTAHKLLCDWRELLRDCRRTAAPHLLANEESNLKKVQPQTY